MQRAADKGIDEARGKLKYLSPAPTDGALEFRTVMQAVKWSNVRAGPGTGYAKVGLLEVGEIVRVTNATNSVSGWSRRRAS